MCLFVPVRLSICLNAALRLCLTCLHPNGAAAQALLLLRLLSGRADGEFPGCKHSSVSCTLCACLTAVVHTCVYILCQRDDVHKPMRVELRLACQGVTVRYNLYTETNPALLQWQA